nr:multidrug efflux MFS transporter [Evansella caseinilytica]
MKAVVLLIGVLLHAIGWGLMSMPSTTAGLNGLSKEEVSDGNAFTNLWRQMFRALSVVLIIQLYSIVRELGIAGVSLLYGLFGLFFILFCVVVRCE